MASVMGNKLKLSVFGQSHSAAIGGCIDGLPAGLTVDMGRVLEFMKRRAPGQNAHSTARKEADMPIVLSGLSDNVTSRRTARIYD